MKRAYYIFMSICFISVVLCMQEDTKKELPFHCDKSFYVSRKNIVKRFGMQANPCNLCDSVTVPFSIELCDTLPIEIQARINHDIGLQSLPLFYASRFALSEQKICTCNDSSILTFSDDGTNAYLKRVGSSLWKKTIPTGNESCLHNLSYFAPNVTGAVVHDHEQMYRTNDGKIFYTQEDTRPIVYQEICKSRISAVDFSRDKVVIGLSSGRYEVLDKQSMELLYTYFLDRHAIPAIQVHNDIVYVGLSGKKLYIDDTRSHTSHVPTYSTLDEICSMKIVSDRTLLIGGVNGSLSMLDTRATHKKLYSIKSQLTNPITAVAAPDETTIVAGSCGIIATYKIDCELQKEFDAMTLKEFALLRALYTGTAACMQNDKKEAKSV